MSKKQRGDLCGYGLVIGYDSHNDLWATDSVEDFDVLCDAFDRMDGDAIAFERYIRARNGLTIDV